ncbi:MAG: DUF5591 domain-containing protein, partial [Thermoplasmata archaeon]
MVQGQENMFEVLKRCGLARIGEWHLEGQKAQVTTPNVLFIDNERFGAPNEAEALISHREDRTGKPRIKTIRSLFAGSNENVSGYSVSPHIEYPPSRVDLNALASEMNAKRAESRVFVVAQKGEALAEGLEKTGAEVFVLANALHLARNPRDLVSSLVSLRKAVGYQKLIYTPGLGSPQHMAFLAYLGVDLFDSVPLIVNARKGYYVTGYGRAAAGEVTKGFCFCPACVSENNDFDSILAHNYYTSISELDAVCRAIRGGMLGEYVESKAVTDPKMLSAVRLLDSNFFEFQEMHVPVSGGYLIAATSDSLFRPEITRFRRRILERYAKPPHKKVLLLLPCSAKKPYSFSKSHKAFKYAVAQSGRKNVIHEVIITSPLGVVPREVELFYPAQQYDIPVTGTWTRDEKAMIGETLARFLEINEYYKIIVHLPEDYEFVEEYLDEYSSTSQEKTTSQDSLARLKEALLEAVKSYKKVSGQVELQESMKCFARFQFGNAGCALIENTRIKGRYPNLKIFKDEKQIGMLVGERGLISLTLEGGRVLAEIEAYLVEISDLTPKGDIFAVGVEA